MEYEQEQSAQQDTQSQTVQATQPDANRSNPSSGSNTADSPGFVEALGNLFANLWRGIPYAAAIMLILVPHEMGHYLMMRRQQIAASLPYFIPAPLISPFGTFGAAIQLRETLKNRRKLLDVGAAGPIAGFVFAVPILLIGLATSPVAEMSGPVGFVEGNSLLYAFSKFIIFGEVLPAGGRDVLLNQLAWAGWTGLFVTAINMIPLGQLDGGHVLYSLLGETARKLYWPLLGVMVALTLFVSSVWLLIAVMLFFVGRVYAVPMDTITPLDRPRKLAGIAALVIFVLTFPPVPIYIPGESGGLLTGMIGAVVSLSLVRRWWHLRQLQSAF
jgi:membrane-associated protease RseP (regulator of RpoE activity)